jgi:hypothetical protein
MRSGPKLSGAIPVKSHDLYETWCSMIKRCENENHQQYRDYGGRGIFVCARWRSSFWTFVSDMGERPVGYTLERRDNKLEYNPENCYWATRKEQNRNTRFNKILTYKGISKCVSAWEEDLGFLQGTIKRRLYRGFTVEEALETPLLSGWRKKLGKPLRERGRFISKA